MVLLLLVLSPDTRGKTPTRRGAVAAENSGMFSRSSRSQDLDADTDTDADAEQLESVSSSLHQTPPGVVKTKPVPGPADCDPPSKKPRAREGVASDAREIRTATRTATRTRPLPSAPTHPSSSK